MTIIERSFSGGHHGEGGSPWPTKPWPVFGSTGTYAGRTGYILNVLGDFLQISFDGKVENCPYDQVEIHAPSGDGQFDPATVAINRPVHGIEATIAAAKPLAQRDWKEWDTEHESAGFGALGSQTHLKQNDGLKTGFHSVLGSLHAASLHFHNTAAYLQSQHDALQHPVETTRAHQEASARLHDLADHLAQAKMLEEAERARLAAHLHLQAEHAARRGDLKGALESTHEANHHLQALTHSGGFRSWEEWDEEHMGAGLPGFGGPGSAGGKTPGEIAAGKEWGHAYGEAGAAAMHAHEAEHAAATGGGKKGAIDKSTGKLTKKLGVPGFLSKGDKKAMNKGGGSQGQFSGTGGGGGGKKQYTPEETAAYNAKKAAKDAAATAAQKKKNDDYAASRSQYAGGYDKRDLHAEGTWGKKGHNSRYGTVMFDGKGHVLIREPSGHFDGIAAAFSKGGADPGEHPAMTAIRESEEETGITPRIIGHIPGGFTGTSSMNHYYVAVPSEKEFDASMMNGETSKLMWATPKQADHLMQGGTNAAGINRDRRTLRAAVSTYEGMHPNEPKSEPLDPVPPLQPKSASVNEIKKSKVRPPIVLSETSSTPTAEEHLDHMTKVSGPRGSNPSQWYQDHTGQRYMLKMSKSDDHAENEVAVGATYHAAGIPVPETRVITMDNGEKHVVSKGVGGLHPWTGTPEHQAEARKGFGIDALTSNWDALGLANDNAMTTSKGRVVRIDQGGGGYYRAMGKPKDDAFAEGKPWVDHQTLRTSPQGQKLYGAPPGTHNDEIAQSLQSAKDLDLAKVDQTMAERGVSKAFRDDYLGVLRDRQAQIPAAAAAAASAQPQAPSAAKQEAAHEWGEAGAKAEAEKPKTSLWYPGMKLPGEEERAEPDVFWSIDDVELRSWEEWDEEHPYSGSGHGGTFDPGQFHGPGSAGGHTPAEEAAGAAWGHAFGEAGSAAAKAKAAEAHAEAEGKPAKKVAAPSNLSDTDKDTRAALAAHFADQAENLPHHNMSHDGAGGRRARFARGFVNARLKAHDANMSKDEAFARSRMHLAKAKSMLHNPNRAEKAGYAAGYKAHAIGWDGEKGTYFEQDNFPKPEHPESAEIPQPTNTTPLINESELHTIGSVEHEDLAAKAKTEKMTAHQIPHYQNGVAEANEHNKNNALSAAALHAFKNQHLKHAYAPGAGDAGKAYHLGAAYGYGVHAAIAENKPAPLTDAEVEQKKADWATKHEQIKNEAYEKAKSELESGEKTHKQVTQESYPDVHNPYSNAIAPKYSSAEQESKAHGMKVAVEEYLQKHPESGAVHDTMEDHQDLAAKVFADTKEKLASGLLSPKSVQAEIGKHAKDIAYGKEHGYDTNAISATKAGKEMALQDHNPTGVPPTTTVAAKDLKEGDVVMHDNGPHVVTHEWGPNMGSQFQGHMGFLNPATNKTHATTNTSPEHPFTLLAKNTSTEAPKVEESTASPKGPMKIGGEHPDHWSNQAADHPIEGHSVEGNKFPPGKPLHKSYKKGYQEAIIKAHAHNMTAEEALAEYQKVPSGKTAYAIATNGGKKAGYRAHIEKVGEKSALEHSEISAGEVKPVVAPIGHLPTATPEELHDQHEIGWNDALYAHSTNSFSQDELHHMAAQGEAAAAAHALTSKNDELAKAQLTGKAAGYKSLAENYKEPEVAKSSAPAAPQELPKHESELEGMKKVKVGEKFANGEKAPGLGFQGGQWYEHPNGNAYLVKGAQSTEHAENEVAAGLLYKQAGMETAKTGLLTMHNGEKRVISEYQTGLTPLGPAHPGDHVSKNVTPELQKEARKGFGTDALLGHYDIFGRTDGTTGRNLFKNAAGKLVRLDLAGTGRFRGAGSPKGSKLWGVGDWFHNPDHKNAYVTQFAEDHGKQIVYGVPKGQELHTIATDPDVKASMNTAANLDMAKHHQDMLNAGISKKFADKQIAVLQARQDALKAKGMAEGPLSDKADLGHVAQSFASAQKKPEVQESSAPHAPIIKASDLEPGDKLHATTSGDVVLKSVEPHPTMPGMIQASGMNGEQAMFHKDYEFAPGQVTKTAKGGDVGYENGHMAGTQTGENLAAAGHTGTSIHTEANKIQAEVVKPNEYIQGLIDGLHAHANKMDNVGQHEEEPEPEAPKALAKDLKPGDLFSLPSHHVHAGIAPPTNPFHAHHVNPHLGDNHDVYINGEDHEGVKDGFGLSKNQEVELHGSKSVPKNHTQIPVGANVAAWVKANEDEPEAHEPEKGISSGLTDAVKIADLKPGDTTPSGHKLLSIGKSENMPSFHEIKVQGPDGHITEHLGHDTSSVNALIHGHAAKVGKGDFTLPDEPVHGVSGLTDNVKVGELHVGSETPSGHKITEMTPNMAGPSDHSKVTVQGPTGKLSSHIFYNQGSVNKLVEAHESKVGEAVPSGPKVMDSARYENTSGNHNKFYETVIHDLGNGKFAHTTRYGSMTPGAHVTEKTVEHPSYDVAKAAHEKAVANRIEHGYSYAGVSGHPDDAIFKGIHQSVASPEPGYNSVEQSIHEGHGDGYFEAQKMIGNGVSDDNLHAQLQEHKDNIDHPYTSGVHAGFKQALEEHGKLPAAAEPEGGGGAPMGTKWTTPQGSHYEKTPEGIHFYNKQGSLLHTHKTPDAEDTINKMEGIKKELPASEPMDMGDAIAKANADGLDYNKIFDDAKEVALSEDPGVNQDNLYDHMNDAQHHLAEGSYAAAAISDAKAKGIASAIAEMPQEENHGQLDEFQKLPEDLVMGDNYEHPNGHAYTVIAPPIKVGNMVHVSSALGHAGGEASINSFAPHQHIEILSPAENNEPTPTTKLAPTTHTVGVHVPNAVTTGHEHHYLEGKQAGYEKGLDMIEGEGKPVVAPKYLASNVYYKKAKEGLAKGDAEQHATNLGFAHGLAAATKEKKAEAAGKPTPKSVFKSTAAPSKDLYAAQLLKDVPDGSVYKNATKGNYTFHSNGVKGKENGDTGMVTISGPTGKHGSLYLDPYNSVADAIYAHDDQMAASPTTHAPGSAEDQLEKQLTAKEQNKLDVFGVQMTKEQGAAVLKDMKADDASGYTNSVSHYLAKNGVNQTPDVTPDWTDAFNKANEGGGPPVDSTKVWMDELASHLPAEAKPKAAIKATTAAAKGGKKTTQGMAKGLKKHDQIKVNGVWAEVLNKMKPYSHVLQVKNSQGQGTTISIDPSTKVTKLHPGHPEYKTPEPGAPGSPTIQQSVAPIKAPEDVAKAFEESLKMQNWGVKEAAPPSYTMPIDQLRTLFPYEKAFNLAQKHAGELSHAEAEDRATAADEKRAASLVPAEQAAQLGVAEGYRAAVKAAQNVEVTEEKSEVTPEELKEMPAFKAAQEAANAAIAAGANSKDLYAQAGPLSKSDDIKNKAAALAWQEAAEAQDFQEGEYPDIDISPGHPDLTDQQVEFMNSNTGAGNKNPNASPMEQWAYNFGRALGIETGNKALSDEAFSAADIEHAALHHDQLAEKSVGLMKSKQQGIAHVLHRIAAAKHSGGSPITSSASKETPKPDVKWHDPSAMAAGGAAAPMFDKEKQNPNSPPKPHIFSQLENQSFSAFHGPYRFSSESANPKNSGSSFYQILNRKLGNIPLKPGDTGHNLQMAEAFLKAFNEKSAPSLHTIRRGTSGSEFTPSQWQAITQSLDKGEPVNISMPIMSATYNPSTWSNKKYQYYFDHGTLALDTDPSGGEHETQVGGLFQIYKIVKENGKVKIYVRQLVHYGH